MTQDHTLYTHQDVEEALAAVDRANPTIIGILLAGGTSSRFGSCNKLLAEIDGKPLIRNSLGTVLNAPVDQILVVLGHEADAIQQALAGFDVNFVRNGAYAKGLSTSVKCGVRAARDADAAVFLPGDMPDVGASSVALLVDAYRGGLGTALAAAYRGSRGNPVLFDHSHFAALTAIAGDTGGRSVFAKANDRALIETSDPGVRHDIDSLDDLQRRRNTSLNSCGHPP